MKIGSYKGRTLVIDNDHKGRLDLAGDPYMITRGEAQLSKELTPVTFKPEDLELIAIEPQQIFAVGMNYADHSKEIHSALPKVPNIFTKFNSSLAKANTTVKMYGPKTDWETELVVMIGKTGRNISKADVRDYVAGVMVGEDLSDRDVQFANASPQFSMGKSFENYGVVGPYLTTLDEIDDLDSEVITTKVNGEIVQQAPLGQMIFNIEDLIAYISSITELMPGDLIFTGTPSGTGVGRDPQRFLKPGDVLTGEITHLGKLTMTMA